MTSLHRLALPFVFSLAVPSIAFAQVYALECLHQSPTTIRGYSAVAVPCVLSTMNDAVSATTASVTVTVSGTAIPVDGVAADRSGRVVAFELPNASGTGSRMVVIDPRTGAATRVGAAIDMLVYGAGFDLDDRLWVVGLTPAAPTHTRVFAEVNPTTGASMGARSLTGDLTGAYAGYIPAMDVAALPQGGLAVLDTDEVTNGYDRVFTLDPSSAGP